MPDDIIPKPHPTRLPDLMPPREAGGNGTLQAGRLLPDRAICRAKGIGIASFADCLVDPPVICAYSQSFGFGYFCHHPEREVIIARTEAQ